MNFTKAHDDDFVGHRESFFLVVRDVNESYAEAFVHIHKFELHIFAHFEVECAERLVEKQNFGFVDQSACDCNALLLSAAQRGHVSVAVVFEVNHFESVVDFFFDFRFRVLSEKLDGFAFLVGFRAVGYDFEFQTERNVIENVEMREERVFLKYGVDGAKVRRSVRDVFAVENDFSACGHFKARNHAKSGGLAATARTEQGDEFAALYREAGVFDHLLAVVLFVDVAKFDDVVNRCLVCHMCFLGCAALPHDICAMRR